MTASLMASREDRRLAGTTTSSGAFSSSAAAAALKSRDFASISSASWASTLDALQPISVDFFLLNEPNLNGDAKLFFFLGGVASTAVVVVVVAVLSRRRR